MSEENKRDAELRQIITDALVSMVSGVTGLVPPAGPGAIPDFIQAPIDRAVERISASLPVCVPEGSIYVECCQCDECQHGGINDAAAGLAACHDCDWTGPDPVEDKCPGCQSENSMAAACPKCGSRYVLVASEDIAAPVAPAAPTIKAERVSVPVELLRRVCWPVASGSDRHTHSEAVAELRALLASHAEGGKV